MPSLSIEGRDVPLQGFQFGLEGEYLLVEAGTYRPLWHPDLSFRDLIVLLESIRWQPLLRGLTLDGLELDPPHRKMLPYYVEGYGVPDRELTTYVDILPKGIEIRTPVCPSLDSCLAVYEDLYQALQTKLFEAGYRAVGLAHHPTAWDFDAPQNHRRHDWWQWALQAMTTYGPDLNVSLPQDRTLHFDWDDLCRRTDYYAPALVAFSLAAPLARGRLWEIHGRQGFSARTYRRSVAAPALAAHPKEGYRLEFKAFDMPAGRAVFRAYFLLWLWLILDDAAPGRAERADCVRDLGAAACLGWDAPEVVDRAEQALDRAARLLGRLDIDPSPLAELRTQLGRRETPADAMIQQMRADPNVPALLAHLDRTASEARAAINR